MQAHRKTRRELNELAERLVRHEVYLAIDGPMLEHSFGHLFMMMEPPPSREEAATIGGVYEELSKALPRGVNGYPFFVSGHFLHVDDVAPLYRRIEKKERALKGSLLSRLRDLWPFP